MTGATGFIGSALIASLNRQFFETIAAVRSNVEKCNNASKVVSISDINGSTDWNKCLDCVDVVIHLAARVHVMDERATDPLAIFLETNLNGTINLAEQAAKAGVKRFVFVSTIGVNGSHTEDGKPFNEQSIALPYNDYAQSKFLAEEALKKISLTSGMEFVILRPPLIYGPNPKGNFKTLLNVVTRKIPLPLSRLQNKRSFIFLENLVDAIVTCAFHPKAANETYLVSDYELLSTPKMIALLAKALKQPNMLFPFPLPLLKFLAKLLEKKHILDKLTQSLMIDTSKIRKELSWHPPFTIEQGLKITANWYLDELSSKSTKKCL